MAFTPEDGSGLPAANSFSAVDEYTAWLTDRGLTLKNAGSEEAQLVQAADHMERLYACRFAGDRAVAGQRLSFPRTELVDGLTGDAVPSTGAASIPDGLKEAQFSFAYEIDQNGPLMVSPKIHKSGRRVKRRKLDVIETEFVEGGVTMTTRSVPQATRLLTRYLRSSGRRRTIRA